MIEPVFQRRAQRGITWSSRAWWCAAALASLVGGCDRTAANPSADGGEVTSDAAGGEPDGGSADPEAGASGSITCRSERDARETITPAPDQICDGHPDCSHSEDEVDCPGVFVCPKFSTWSDVEVIDAALVCNGVADCYRADDELECPDLELSFCEEDDNAGIKVYRPEQRCDGHAECFYADDEVDCPDSFLCPKYEIGGGRVAIPRSQVCDGNWQCTIDEFDCPNVTDPFVCPSGKAIDRKFLCDQAADCDHTLVDGRYGPADEVDPSCHQYACRNTLIDTSARAPCSGCKPWFISDSKVCDGARDCQEGDDELDCPAPFACAGGLFVRSRAVCDGKPDCPQGDDESSCP